MITFTCSLCDRPLTVKPDLAGKRVKCPKCKEVIAVPDPESDDHVPEAFDAAPPSGALKALYIACILAGAGLAFFLYVVAFNKFSETELVNLSLAWVFPLAFGLYGLAAQYFIQVVREGREGDLWEAISSWARAAGLYGVLGVCLLLPFVFVKRWQNSLLVALIATLFWWGLLVAFFKLVFPSL